MNWIQNVEKWQALPEQVKLRRRWESIPTDVAQSMAFAGQPVDLARLIELHSKIPPPALLRTPARQS